MQYYSCRIYFDPISTSRNRKSFGYPHISCLKVSSLVVDDDTKLRFYLRAISKVIALTIHFTKDPLFPERLFICLASTNKSRLRSELGININGT